MKTTNELVNEHRLINVQDVPWEADLWEDFVFQMMREHGVEVSQLHIVESPRVKARFAGEVCIPEYFIDTCFGAEAYPMVRRMLSYEYGAVTIRCIPTFVSSLKATPNVYCRATSFREMDEFRFDPLARAVAADFDNRLEGEVRSLRKRCLEAFAGWERDLSARLGRLYDDLTSDEAVWATMCELSLDKSKELSA